MNRKQFIQSQGATCKNWMWSWSFISHDRQMVIFGAWDSEREQERAVILREEWEFSAKKMMLPGYTQALEHLGYLNEGYDLYTFNMIHSPKPDNPAVAAIKGFEHRLEKRWLRKEGSVWYADVIGHAYPDELQAPELYSEGARKVISVNAYERNPGARQACIRHHGTVCKGCGFDFEKTYGEHGKGFIHVHHLRSLSSISESYRVDPVLDMIPLCPNCHAMVHRGNESRPLSLDTLRKIIACARSQATATTTD